MKRQLLLVRHAKSSREDTSWADWERPLHARGRADLQQMQAVLQNGAFKPDVWYCSTANRALATAFGLLQIEPSQETIIQVKPQLYTFDALVLKAFISKLPKSQKKVAIVGHNPAIETLLHKWLPASILPTKVPTLAMIWLTFEAEVWANVQAKTLIKLSIDTPKDARTAL